MSIFVVPEHHFNSFSGCPEACREAQFMVWRQKLVTFEKGPRRCCPLANPSAIDEWHAALFLGLSFVGEEGVMPPSPFFDRVGGRGA
jgi:hypothetical protein